MRNASSVVLVVLLAVLFAGCSDTGAPPPQPPHDPLVVTSFMFYARGTYIEMMSVRSNRPSVIDLNAHCWDAEFPDQDAFFEANNVHLGSTPQDVSLLYSHGWQGGFVTKLVTCRTTATESVSGDKVEIRW